jgi:hypothetical protein
MKINGLTVTESEVSQSLDLEKLTGVDLSVDPDLMQEIAQATIDYVRERTSETLGVGRKKLPSPYSESYSESLDFQAAGKSRGTVNLELSGTMLDSIDVLEFDGSKLKYGIQGGEQAIKAFAHQTGFEGHPTIKNVRPREFVGVTDSEFKEFILPKFKDDIKDVSPSPSNTQSIINDIRSIKNLFDSIDEPTALFDAIYGGTK